MGHNFCTIKCSKPEVNECVIAGLGPFPAVGASFTGRHWGWGSRTPALGALPFVHTPATVVGSWGASGVLGDVILVFFGVQVYMFAHRNVTHLVMKQSRRSCK